MSSHKKPRPRSCVLSSFQATPAQLYVALPPCVESPVLVHDTGQLRSALDSATPPLQSPSQGSGAAPGRPRSSPQAHYTCQPAAMAQLSLELLRTELQAFIISETQPKAKLIHLASIQLRSVKLPCYKGSSRKRVLPAAKVLAGERDLKGYVTKNDKAWRGHAKMLPVGSGG
jgi:hypothetical protein